MGTATHPRRGENSAVFLNAIIKVSFYHEIVRRSQSVHEYMCDIHADRITERESLTCDDNCHKVDKWDADYTCHRRQSLHQSIQI